MLFYFKLQFQNQVDKVNKTNGEVASFIFMQTILSGVVPKCQNSEGKSQSNLCWDVWNQIGNKLAPDETGKEDS